MHDSLRKRAEAYGHSFINKIVFVAEQADWSVGFAGHDPDSLLSSITRLGYATLCMIDPFHDRTLIMRRVYEYPFWTMEDRAKRWEWPVARRSF